MSSGAKYEGQLAASLAILEFLVLPLCCPLSFPLSTEWVNYYLTVDFHVYHQVAMGARPGVPGDQNAATMRWLPLDSSLLSPYLSIIASPRIPVLKMTFSRSCHLSAGMSLSFCKDPRRMTSLGKSMCSLDPNSTSQECFFFLSFLCFLKIISHFCSLLS